MRKALIVGVDYYEKIGSLHGCVNDALAVAGVLEEHANHGTNFITPNVLTATSKEDAITRRIWPDPVKWSTANESRSLVDTGGSVAGRRLIPQR